MPKAYKFSKPITIAEKKYTHFEMRESTVEHMFEAELELSVFGGGVHTPLQFNGQLMVRQITKVTNESGEEFPGPFTMNMLKAWGKPNYSVLRDAQQEVEELGEDSESE